MSVLHFVSRFQIIVEREFFPRNNSPSKKEAQILKILPVWRESIFERRFLTFSEASKNHFQKGSMLAASLCRELHFTVLPPTVNSRVPRCLFGSPNPKDTVDLLQEALEVERTRFASRWGVDPRSENDKENILQRYEKVERSPKKKCSPYSRQTNIHGELIF